MSEADIRALGHITPRLAVERVTLLCGAAEMPIRNDATPADAVRTRTRGVEDEFHSALLTLRHGVKVYNGEQLAFIPSVSASTSPGAA